MAYFYYNIHYYNIHLYYIKSTLTLARLGPLWCNFTFLTTCPQGKLDMKISCPE
jgi:hypothetical protein